MPQVRQSVPGPETTGQSPSNAFRFFPQSPLRYRLKAFEKNMFGPGTLMRTWGTRLLRLTVVLRKNLKRFVRLYFQERYFLDLTAPGLNRRDQ